jgi:hypothetical protein
MWIPTACKGQKAGILRKKMATKSRDSEVQIPLFSVALVSENGNTLVKYLGSENVLVAVALCAFPTADFAIFGN